MGSDPVARAFEELVAELYWAEDLREAEERLEEFIRGMDEDLRELLLERRKRICSNPELVSRAGAALQGLEPSTLKSLPGDLGVKASVIAALVNALFLVQCTPTWSRMDPDSKARILAPLYRASYALRLASRGGGDTAALIEEAVDMASIALDRISRAGLLEEMEALASSR